MVNIPTYFRGQLASEQTGVNTPDKSGQIIANAAGSFFQASAQLVAERKQVLDKVEISNALTKVQTDYIRQSKAIKENPDISPEEMEFQLNGLVSSLKESTLSGASGSSLKENMGRVLGLEENKAKITHALLRIEKENLKAQNDLFTAVEDLAQVAGETTNLADYKKIIASIEEKKGDILPLVGFDLEKADVFMKNAKAQATTRYAYNLVERGEAVTAWGYVEGGMFEGSGLEGKAKLDFSNNLRNALKGEQTRNNLKTAVNVVDEFGVMVDKMNLEGVSLVDLQERELNIAYGLNAGGLTPFQEAVKKTELKVIGAFIDREVTATAVTAVDGDAKEDLYARLGALTTKTEEGKKDWVLEQMFELMNDAAEAYGADNGISAKTYRKIVGRISREIMTEFELGDTLGKGFGGSVKGTAVKKEGRKVFQELYRAMEKEAGFSNTWVANTYDAYLDIKDRYGDEIPNEAMKAVQAEALRKGWLKTHGYDELLEVGDSIDTPLGPQVISSFTGGKPNVTTKELNFDDMQMIGQ